MKVRIVEDFTGYPDGTDASRRLFRAGEEVEEADDFGKLIVEKGHAVGSHSSPHAQASEAQADIPLMSPSTQEPGLCR